MYLFEQGKKELQEYITRVAVEKASQASSGKFQPSQKTSLKDSHRIIEQNFVDVDHQADSARENLGQLESVFANMFSKQF